MTALIGHNKGPTLERGAAWRTHCWTAARRQLLPKLPVEVIRNRVRRAAEIGLDYKTYATVRAGTGRDIVAFLFSTNALRLFRAEQALDAARAEKLAAVSGCRRKALVIAPLTAGAVLAAHGEVLDGAAAAPHVHGSWPETARAIGAARGTKTPADAVLLIGDTGMERDWSVAGRLAGYLEASRFFAVSSG